jgi:transposase
MFDVGNVYDLKLAASSFYAQLAEAALFSDEDFARLYSQKMGRPSVPPSQLALSLLLQQYEGVSDQEAIDRSAYDLRWCAVLARPAGTPLCAKSTLQLFRAHLILHDQVRQVFLASIEAARRAGRLKGSIRVAIDTKPVLCQGAVLDTINLLAAALLELARAQSLVNAQPLHAFLEATGLTRYANKSVKGSADIDWSDEQARQAFLGQIVADARLLLGICSGQDERVKQAASMLGALLLQDIEPPKPVSPQQSGTQEPQTPPASTSQEAAPMQVKQGTARGRIPSVTDPQARHGRKSSSKTFVGHKASVAVDIESGIIVAADILPGDAPDSTGALELVAQAEANAGVVVSETLADCAYGGGPTRQAFEAAQRTLIAKVGKETSANDHFPKSAFEIDTQARTATCPAGHTVKAGKPEADGGIPFHFGRHCKDCALRSLCTTSKTGRGVTGLPHENQLRAARAYQQSKEGAAHLRQRVAIEHALARLARLGISQARYRGWVKTRYQLLMAATVANLRLICNQSARKNGKEPDNALTCLLMSGMCCYAGSLAASAAR